MCVIITFLPPFLNSQSLQRVVKLDYNIVLPLFCFLPFCRATNLESIDQSISQSINQQINQSMGCACIECKSFVLCWCFCEATCPAYSAGFLPCISVTSAFVSVMCVLFLYFITISQPFASSEPQKYTCTDIHNLKFCKFFRV